MKFINYLTSIAGIEIYPLISLMIFFGFFLVLIIWTFKVDKSYLNGLKNIPLDKEINKENL